MGTSRGRQILNADPAIQRKLLEVQALDQKLDQLAHRRASVAEKPVVDELTADRKHLESELVTTDTEVADLSRAQRKADADVDQVRTRKAKDEERLNAGRVSSPKELEGLQHEIETLIKRQSDLEDVELEIMEQIEAASEKQSGLRSKLAELAEKLSTAEQALGHTYAEIDGQSEKLRADRANAVTGIDEPLLALYERLRAQKNGVGAAMLKQRRCEGCRMELDATFLSKLKTVAADLVVRCEECSRILVRTPESGL